MKPARTVAKIFNKPTNTFVQPESDEVVFHSRVGIEIEVEGYEGRRRDRFIQRPGVIPNDNENLDLWRIVNDGSLRNGGAEFVSIPVAGVNITQALEQFDTFIEDKDLTISERAGVHVHLDMTDATLKQLRNFLVVYTIYEKDIFNYVDEDRMNNPYCVPITESLELQDLLSSFSGSDRNIHSAVNRWPKYSALNCAALLRYGTLEFRMHEATLDTARMLEFINLILSMKRFVFTNPKITIQTIIDSVCLDAEGLTKEVYKDTILEEYTEERMQRMLEGARVAQQFYRQKPINIVTQPEELEEPVAVGVQDVRMDWGNDDIDLEGLRAALNFRGGNVGDIR